MPNSIRPSAVTRFKTGTAALAVFDPACLRHRATDSADWWCLEQDEVAEVNAGNVFFVDLGADGIYDCKIYRDKDRHQTAQPACQARIRNCVGCFYIGSGEQVLGEGMGPDTSHGGVLLAAPNGTWEVQAYRENPGTIVVRLYQVEGEATNDLQSRARLR